MVDGQHCRWFNLHKTPIHEDGTHPQSTIILLEDQTELQQLEHQLMHKERLASIGSLAAGVAHEIGNPVTNIDCLAQEISAQFTDDELQQAVVQIREQAQRIVKILQSLLNLAHSGNALVTSPQPGHLQALVQQAIDWLLLDKQLKPVHLDNQVDPQTQVACEPQRLLQVFINLLKNAIDASPPQGLILIQSEQDDINATLTIENPGPGIRADQLQRIFDPFFTTKAVGQGTGLGLPLAHSIINEHFGQLKLESPIDPVTQQGTRVIIQLPLFSPA